MWLLRVADGELVGLIGLNGAGNQQQLTERIDALLTLWGDRLWWVNYSTGQ